MVALVLEGERRALVLSDQQNVAIAEGYRRAYGGTVVKDRIHVTEQDEAV